MEIFENSPKMDIDNVPNLAIEKQGGDDKVISHLKWFLKTNHLGYLFRFSHQLVSVFFSISITCVSVNFFNSKWLKKHIMFLTIVLTLINPIVKQDL